MISEKSLKERYRRDAVPIRLGNLASSLERFSSFLSLKKFDDTNLQLLRECRLFAAWTIPDAGQDAKADLETLQVDLAGWQNDLENGAADDAQRADISAACTRWAERLLEHSGLLKTGRPVSV